MARRRQVEYLPCRNVGRCRVYNGKHAVRRCKKPNAKSKRHEYEVQSCHPLIDDGDPRRRFHVDVQRTGHAVAPPWPWRWYHDDSFRIYSREVEAIQARIDEGPSFRRSARPFFFLNANALDWSRGIATQTS